MGPLPGGWSDPLRCLVLGRWQGNEATLTSTRQSWEGGTPQGGDAEPRQSAKSQGKASLYRSNPRDRNRASYARARRGVGTGKSHSGGDNEPEFRRLLDGDVSRF